MNNIFLTTIGSELKVQPNGRLFITLTAKENGNNAVEKQWADVENLRITATLPNVSGAVRLPFAINGSQIEIAGYENEWAIGIYKVAVIGNLGGVPFEYNIVLNVAANYENEVSAIIEIPALDAGGTGGGGGGMISTTWAELKALRDNGQLVAGTQYRITDYVATTTALESRSANHPFDVIVTADSASVLNENARAIAHEGDTYFEKCDLAAWQLKYSIDNDVSRWDWAQSALESYAFYVAGIEFPGTLESSEDTTYEGYPYRFAADTGEQYYGNVIVYAPALSGESLNLKVYVISAGATQEFTGDITYVSRKDGKGVIFGMIDENNNNMQYDFKGIQFKRYKITACEKVPSLVGTWASSQHSDDITIDADDFRWCYLFNVMFDDDNKDDSVGFYGGIPADCINLMSGRLPNGVCNIDGNDTPLSCHNWKCGDGCYEWTCGNNCREWTCGNGCQDWTCGDGCYDWTCGNNCREWTCGNGCQDWTCGNDCREWTCGNDCYDWTCGNNCQGWTCGNYCHDWTCGNNCQGWTCPDYGQYFSIFTSTYVSAETLPIITGIDYVQYVGRNSQGVVKVWTPANLVTT